MKVEVEKVPAERFRQGTTRTRQAERKAVTGDQKQTQKFKGNGVD